MSNQTKAAEFSALAVAMREKAKAALDAKFKEAYDDISKQYELMAKQQLTLMAPRICTIGTKPSLDRLRSRNNFDLIGRAP